MHIKYIGIIVNVLGGVKLKFEQLFYFKEAVKYNSISIASEKNYMSQSSVSYSILNLEKVLGGAYQTDAIIRLGKQAVNVDWTTLGQLAEHLERSYLQRAFIIFVHPGLP